MGKGIGGMWGLSADVQEEEAGNGVCAGGAAALRCKGGLAALTPQGVEVWGDGSDTALLCTGWCRTVGLSPQGE